MKVKIKIPVWGIKFREVKTETEFTASQWAMDSSGVIMASISKKVLVEAMEVNRRLNFSFPPYDLLPVEHIEVEGEVVENE